MLILKIAGAVIFTLAISILIKNKSPETALLINIALVVSVCICCSGLIESIVSSFEEAKATVGDADIYLKPLLKCLGVSLITKIGGEVCRDTSNGAAAAALDFAGVVCALSFTMPVITLTVKTVCGLL